jgi:hypothetical protein
MEAVLQGQSRIAPSTAVARPLSSAVAIDTGAPFGAEGRPERHLGPGPAVQRAGPRARRPAGRPGVRAAGARVRPVGGGGEQGPLHRGGCLPTAADRSVLASCHGRRGFRHHRSDRTPRPRRRLRRHRRRPQPAARSARSSAAPSATCSRRGRSPSAPSRSSPTPLRSAPPPGPPSPPWCSCSS